MTSDQSASLELAQSFLKTTENKDLAGLSALIHDDAVFWVNIGDGDVDKASRMARIAVEFQVFQEFGYEQPRIDEFANGFVIRALVKGLVADDCRFEFPICIVAETSAGRIQRLEEYLDAAPVAPILSAMEASLSR